MVTSTLPDRDRDRVGSRSSRGFVVARRVGDVTELAHARTTSPLRLLEPRFPGVSSRAVCIVTFGGGLVDGDSIDLDVVVEPGATLLVFTQATTKVFRGCSSQSLRAEVHGTLVFLPDPVACFRDARYRQRVDVALHGDGACVLLDGFTCGRAAYGDRWDFDRLETRTSIERDGVALVRDALVLDARDAPIAPRAARFDAFATIIAYGERVRPVTSGVLGLTEAAPLHLPDAEVVIAASPLPAAPLPPAGAIARVAATSPAMAMAEVRRRLRNLPDIDVVDPFASRF